MKANENALLNLNNQDQLNNKSKNYSHKSKLGLYQLEQNLFNKFDTMKAADSEFLSSNTSSGSKSKKALRTESVDNIKEAKSEYELNLMNTNHKINKNHVKKLELPLDSQDIMNKDISANMQKRRNVNKSNVAIEKSLSPIKNEKSLNLNQNHIALKSPKHFKNMNHSNSAPLRHSHIQQNGNLI